MTNKEYPLHFMGHFKNVEHEIFFIVAIATSKSSLFYVALSNCCTFMPVQALMLWSHDMILLPTPLWPSVFPSIITFSKLCLSFPIMWPRYQVFLSLMLLLVLAHCLWCSILFGWLCVSPCDSNPPIFKYIFWASKALYYYLLL